MNILHTSGVLELCVVKAACNSLNKSGFMLLNQRSFCCNVHTSCKENFTFCTTHIFVIQNEHKKDTGCHTKELIGRVLNIQSIFFPSVAQLNFSLCIVTYLERWINFTNIISSTHTATLALIEMFWKIWSLEIVKYNSYRYVSHKKNDDWKLGNTWTTIGWLSVISYLIEPHSYIYLEKFL